ncbi:MAG: hypothetical protein PWR10_1834 [Halanaerobiales bacterium]|nr:hypothetical protein [Halanaerobiales bacterium]
MPLYDQDIRGPLLNKLSKLEPYSSDPSTVVIPEMDVCAGNARIDIAVINHNINGYEIKSERDTLERLPSQIEFYNKFFDNITLVVSGSHFSKAKEIIPDWWGIEYVVEEEDSLVIYSEREPRQNKELDILSLACILWKSEQLELLKKYGITKGVKSKTRYELAEKIVNNVSNNDIKEYVKEKLKSRESWRAVPIQQLCDG